MPQHLHKQAYLQKEGYSTDSPSCHPATFTRLALWCFLPESFLALSKDPGD